MTDIIFDCETYCNCFTLAAEHAEYPITWSFEISDYRNDSEELYDWLQWNATTGNRMVGFNNVGFDYPILHMFIKMRKATAGVLYEKAMEIIKSRNDDEDKFSHTVFPSDRYIAQLDLYKIWHFDNVARMTSLKALEFNMRMENVDDLPFPVGSTLNQDQIKVLKAYNAHDVAATKKFYHKSLDMIRFREELTKKHNRDFMNHNDTKIGKDYLQMELERAGVQLYDYGKQGRTMRQSKREYIMLKDCIPDWITLSNPEFQRVKTWLSQQVIAETKGVFKDLTANAYGLEFVFGTGGLHASVENKMYQADDEMMILDVDVASLYPSIAIVNRYYPEHLTEKFVDIYANLKEQRFHYKKGTPENAMLKLALNGTYGASNDKFSVFYDPKFTMQITIGGQLMICMLVERLAQFGQIIQTNTDGVTCYIPRSVEAAFRESCKQWETITKLELEYVEYTKMAIRDCNNYLAVYAE